MLVYQMKVITGSELVENSSGTRGCNCVHCVVTVLNGSAGLKILCAKKLHKRHMHFMKFSYSKRYGPKGVLGLIWIPRKKYYTST